MEKTSLKAFKLLLAQRIKQLRIEARLTQQEVATKIGFKDKQVINSYEIRGANPTAFNLLKIANALNVSVDSLLDFDNLKKQ